MFVFNCNSLNDVLKIEVWDRDVDEPEDDQLGNLEIFLPSLASCVTANRRVEFEFTLQNIEHGQLFLGIEMSGKFKFSSSHPRSSVKELAGQLLEKSRAQLKNNPVHILMRYYSHLNHFMPLDQAEMIVKEFVGRENHLFKLLEKKYKIAVASVT